VRTPDHDGVVLVLNSGSSSLKYSLLRASSGEALASGVAEQIGEPSGRLTHHGPDGAHHVERELADHDEALRAVLEAFEDHGPALSEVHLAAIGHRVVHGGTRFSEPVRVADDVVAAIEELVPLAPLHNPANLAGIRTAGALFPGLPQVAVFDTAFHRTLPASAATYAIDTAVAQEHGIARYGFHGTSHGYVSRRTAALLNRPLETVNTISLHLGNGASACATRGGRSIATSMGLSPLEGLVMGTRSGDIDPAVVFQLHRVAGMSMDAIDDLLNSHSGLLGLCGQNDLREVLRHRGDGDPAAILAFDIYCARITSYVGAYYATLRRVDAITFTAGVGENSPDVRAAALEGLERLGIVVDADRNRAAGRGERLISPDDAEVAVCVIPTDEELEIATQTAQLLLDLPRADQRL
jgi:acetate kinase